MGLPNVGKSTLFNALLKRQQAFVANFPFATIEPNVGIVPVPDDRLKKLSQVIKESEGIDHLPPEVPATVEFIDIAGLIKGAHKGEGLGNKFLSYIREVDAICHVVRTFTNQDIVKEGSIDPLSDFEVVETELMMADLQTVQNAKLKIKNDSIFKKILDRLEAALEQGKPARKLAFSDQELKEVKALSLLSLKPILIVLNIDEKALQKTKELEQEFSNLFGVPKEQIIAVSAKVEEDLAALDQEDQKLYLKELGIDRSGLERVIQRAYKTLNLITFLTAGKKEVRAWTVKKGSPAPFAASVIHTDFEKKFIKADVVKFDEFIALGGWKDAREKGKVRSEGKNYEIKEGDVIEFKISP